MNHFSITFWFCVGLHLIPLYIALRYLYSHYINKPKRDTEHATVNLKIQNEYIEDTYKISHITLNLLVAVVIVMIFDTFVLLNVMQSTSDETLANSKAILEQLNPNIKEVYTTGTDGIYEEVKKEFNERKNFETVLEIDIIGYTMFSVEPKLKDWQNLGYLKNVRINLIYLDSNFISNSDLINPIWKQRVIDHVGQINKFIEEHRSELRKNNVTIKLTSYNHIPGIHGFRFRDGRYFVSFSMWDIDNKIKLPTDAQYFILNKDD